MLRIFVLLLICPHFVFANSDDEKSEKERPGQLFELPVVEALALDDYDFSQFALLSKKCRDLRKVVRRAVDKDGRPLKKKRFTVAKLSQDLSYLETVSAVTLDREHTHQSNPVDAPMAIKAKMIEEARYKHLRFIETDVKSYEDFRTLMQVMHKKAEIHVTVSQLFTESDLALFVKDLPSSKRKKDHYVSALERVFSIGLSCESAQVLKDVIEAMGTFIRAGELSPYCPDLYLSVNDPGEYDFEAMIAPFEGRIHVMTNEDIEDGVLDDERNTSPGLYGKRAHEVCRLFQVGDKFDDRVGALFLLNYYQSSTLIPAIDLVISTFPEDTHVITKAKLVRSLAELPEQHRQKAIEAVENLEKLMTIEECHLLLYAFKYFPRYKLNEVASDLLIFVKLILFDKKETDFSYEVIKNLDLFWRFERHHLIKLLLACDFDKETAGDVVCRQIYDLILRCANRPKQEWDFICRKNDS